MKSTFKLIIVTIFILVSLCYAQNNIVYKTIDQMNNMPGENYLPLAKGNISRIELHGYQRDIYGQISYIDRLYMYQVLDTSTVNGRIYYKINQDGEIYYLRNDRINNKVYRTVSLSSINEIVFFDFTLANNAPYLQGDNIVNAYNSGFIRGFTRSDGTYHYVSNNIGFFEVGGYMNQYVCESFLVEALVKSTNGAYLVRNPMIAPVFTPVSIPGTIHSKYWPINFKFYIDSRLASELFDSTAVYSYYKKGNDSIPGVAVRFASANVNTTLTLDSALLAQNYKFYYRFECKDNFIVPSRYYYPETGYNSVDYVSGVTGEESKEMNYSLKQNYPNPFNPATTIEYYIPSESKVNITVYNALGSRIKELYDGSRAQGNYDVKFDGAGLSSGVYFVTIKAASVDGNKSFVDSKKMLLLK